MSRVPRSSSEILDISLNLETGELCIGNITVKPTGAGCDYPEVALDDANALMRELLKLREECFEWRLYAERQHEWRAIEPGVPRTGKIR